MVREVRDLVGVDESEIENDVSECLERLERRKVQLDSRVEHRQALPEVRDRCPFVTYVEADQVTVGPIPHTIASDDVPVERADLDRHSRASGSGEDLEQHYLLVTDLHRR